MLLRPRAALTLVALAFPSIATAHHPGSHATRGADGRVQVEVATTVADDCTFIGAVTLGTPPGLTPPPGSLPTTVQLQRRAGPCRASAGVARAQHVLPAAADLRQLHLFILAPDASVTGSERVQIR
jgi:hypothetical protein